jgi:TOMM system kinase/cyclase fusion protein
MYMSCNSIENTFNSDLYQLGKKIGEGGFGQVYKAIQTSTKKVVAIKFLTLTTDFDVEKRNRYIERFHRESDLIRRLNHPNIVQLIDKGQQADSLLYAVYEYIDGESLKEQLEKKGPLSATYAAEIMACVLDALSHAHDQGVIHRDIKPANIMLYKVGAKTQVKVLDFGIGTLKSEARQLDYKSITLTQETLGTPSYSAPEQLRGEPPVVQTDIYVWGLVFLECLTATPAITGSSLAAIFHQQLSPANIPLGVLAGHNSANFFRRVLNKKAHERPSNTAKLYHEFRHLNFTNLVGNLPSRPDCIKYNNIADDNADKTYDQTLVLEGNLSYSRLIERKQTSVLSVILTTTALDTYLDQSKHNFQDVIDTFHADQMQQCIDIAIRYGAHHVGSLGDTLLFYFGYPNVSDNDSRLCSRAALDIVSNVNNKNSLLKNRQGINTHFQMGMQIGLMLSLANNVPEGKAAHDAMALCRQAKAGQILCSEEVRKLLASYLEFDIQSDTTNNLSTNQRLFSLRGERKLEAFGFLRSTQNDSEFIGREQELKQLKDCIAISGNKLSYIYGDAGIGKSRLVFELRNQSQHLRHFVSQCLPEHKNNALYPIINLVKFKYSLDSSATDTNIKRLKKALTMTELDQQEQKISLFVLSTWLSYPLTKVNQAANLSPDQQKNILFSTLGKLLCLTAKDQDKNFANSFQQNQYLFIFEDFHWVDPTSKDFINNLVQSQVFKQAGHNCCITSRKILPIVLEKQPFCLVPVNKLSEKNSIKFIYSLFAHQPLADSLLSILVDRTDGIPLFIEELSSALQIDHLVHKVNGVFSFVNNDSQAQIPSSLRDSLQQKLDRLQQGKDTAQLASTIGREFDYDLLVASSDKEESQVQSDLEQLKTAELVYLQRKVDGDSYIFKHALVRDAAYESMDRKTLKHCHFIVANILLTYFPKRVDKYPAEIAKHYEKSEIFDLASQYNELAGDRALSMSSNIEAVAFYHKAINSLELTENETEQIALNSKLANAFTMQMGYASEQVKKVQQKIAGLREKNIIKQGLNSKKMSRQAASDCWGQSIFQMVTAKFNDAKSITTDYRNQIPKNHYLYQISPNLSDAFIALWQGELHTSYEFLKKVESLNFLSMNVPCYSQEENTSLYGYNTQVTVKIYMALNHYVLTDNIDESLSLAKDALKLARKSEHPYTLVHCLCRMSLIYIITGDLSSALLLSTEAKNLATNCDIALWLAVANIFIGYCEVLLNNNDNAIIEIRDAIDKYAASGAITNKAIYQTLYADALRHQNNTQLAMQTCNEIINECEKTNDTFYLSETHRIKYLLLKQNATTSSIYIDKELERALKLAKRQSATVFVNRILLIKNQPNV